MLRKQAGLFRKTKRVRKAFAERTLFLYAKATIYTILTQLAAKRGRKSRKKYIKILILQEFLLDEGRIYEYN